MLINKIFHLRQPINKARECVREFGAMRIEDKDAAVRCSMIEPEGIGRFELSAGPGERVSADIREVTGDDPNRILFQSVRGNAEVSGMLEFISIRPNLTEVVLTLDYEAVSPVQRAFETVDRFLNRQLARIEGCFAGDSVAGMSQKCA